MKLRITLILTFNDTTSATLALTELNKMDGVTDIVIIVYFLN